MLTCGQGIDSFECDAKAYCFALLDSEESKKISSFAGSLHAQHCNEIDLGKQNVDLSFLMIKNAWLSDESRMGK